jgi:hypothetical protein
MPRRFDPNKLRRAINDYNSAVRRHNANVQRQRTNFRRAVDNYNREVRAHNTRVASVQRQLRQQVQRLAATRVVVRSTVYYRSVTTLHQRYEEVERAAPGTWLEERDDLLDLAQRETSNSLELASSMDVPETANSTGTPSPDPGVDAALLSISTDLAARWRGALFSLDSRNPDAARHFSASSREILTEIVDREASDSDVLAHDPNAPRAHDGRPTRRARLAFCLMRSGRASDSLAAFADADVDNVVELFEVFNAGTHGVAGQYDLRHLSLIKRRVEGAITFLHSILRG